MSDLKRLGTPCVSLICALAAAATLASVAGATSLDSIIDAVFAQQSRMEQEISTASFYARYRYVEMNDAGETTKTVDADRRDYLQDSQPPEHEFIWITVNGRTLDSSQMKGEIKNWQSQQHYVEMTKLPFAPALRDKYNYSLLGDTLWHDANVWKIGFAPKQSGGGYGHGTALVAQQDANIVELEFLPVGLPFILQDMKLVFNYAEVKPDAPGAGSAEQEGYWLPATFHLSMRIVLKAIVTIVSKSLTIDEEYSDYKFNQ
jgi:hypothetical protein